MAEELKEAAIRAGDPDLIDKIADERVATTEEEVLAFLEEVGTPGPGHGSVDVASTRAGIREARSLIPASSGSGLLDRSGVRGSRDGQDAYET